ncbi:uncharacterized protein LOC116268085 isoform X1 [Nymphaea colorata]|nr:uncharacterized protein LOC116268085 isoform X1 [Nymphaea colorata]
MSNLSASTDLQPADGSTRPIVGFPLGTALLVLVIFCISGIVSCCYHYEKIRSLRRSSDSNSASAEPAAEPQDAAATATTKSTPFHQDENKALVRKNLAESLDENQKASYQFVGLLGSSVSTPSPASGKSPNSMIVMSKFVTELTALAHLLTEETS